MPRRTPRLSGVVVCQDNAASIERVLASLEPHCDEIVVVDGGSVDGTQDLVARHDAVRLYERPFDGNISAQKNYAFEQCRGSWILILDTDELLGVRGANRIRPLTYVPFVTWYSFPRMWLVEDGDSVKYLAASPYYRDRQVRLFRNTPQHRYRSTDTPIHHRFVEAGPGRPLRSPHVFHYQFLLQDRASREAKVERYERADAAGAALHSVYLFEDHAVPLRNVPEPLPGMLAPQLRRAATRPMPELTPSPTTAPRPATEARSR